MSISGVLERSPMTTDGLTHAAEMYQKQMNSVAAGYLLSRGLTKAVAETHRLGYVESPEPGDEKFQGMLSIPYFTRSGVRNIKYRCIEDHNCKENGHVKYMQRKGAGTYIYNVADFLLFDDDFICITEGEIDCLSLNVAGLPAVGIPGVSMWKANRHWPMCFSNFRRVYVFADNDRKKDGRNPGMALWDQVHKDLDNAVLVELPENEDVNACLTKYGPEFLAGRVA